MFDAADDFDMPEEPMWFTLSPPPLVFQNYATSVYQFNLKASWRLYAFVRNLPCVEETVLDPENRGLRVYLKPSYTHTPEAAQTCCAGVLERLELYVNNVWGEAAEAALQTVRFDPNETRPYPPFRMEDEDTKKL